MNCRKCKDLIAGGYLDGELQEAAMEQVRRHIGACRGCSAFEEAVRRVAVEPFKQARPMQPSDIVWERIKETIEAEGATGEEGAFAYLKNLLLPVLRMPKPVFAALALAVFAVTAVFVMQWSSARALNGYIQEQADFMVSLDTGPANSGGLGTTIEKSFL